MTKSIENFIRYTLGILLFVVAINAFGGGYYGMVGAKNVPIEWLKGTPFPNYFIPSLILFVCIGGSALIAALLVLWRRRNGSKGAIISAIIIMVWLLAQISMIGYVSWMQPTTAAAAVVILVLAWIHKEH